MEIERVHSIFSLDILNLHYYYFMHHNQLISTKIISLWSLKFNSCIWTAKYTNFISSSDHTCYIEASRQMLLKLIVYFLNPKSYTLSYKLKTIKKNYRAGEEPLKLTFNLQGVDLKQEDIMDTNHTTEVWLMVVLFLLLVTQADGHH